MARGVLHDHHVNELMTKYKRHDIKVPRSDEADLRRALEAAKDDKDADVLINVKSVCGAKMKEFLQDFKEKLQKTQEMEKSSHNFDKVDIVDSAGQDYNAILFIFHTSRCSRLRLRINVNGKLAGPGTVVKVDPNEIKRLLRLQRINLMDGKIKPWCVKADKVILVYVFSQTINCSKAEEQDFFGVKLSDQLLKIQWSSLKFKRNLAWSFFSLSETLDATSDDNVIDDNYIKIKKDFYMKSPKHESERMNCLYSTTKAYVATKRIEAIVEKVDPMHQDSHSQFSGGGDLLIKTYQSTCSVVQQEITAEKMSPIHKGTAMQHLAVEGKKEDWDEDKLKWQLFANMMTAAVSQFLENLKHHYTLQDIEEVQQIVGYGIPYTETGIVGFYKLVIQPEEQTQFITKVTMERRYPQAAAMLVDWFYELYLDKLCSI